MTRIKEAIAKLEALKKECDTIYSKQAFVNPKYVILEVDKVLADLNVHDLDWKPS